MSLRRTLVALVLAVVAHASVSGAQQQPTRPPVRPLPTGVRPDTILRTKADSLRFKRDSIARDSLMAKDSVTRANFAPPDSVMQRMLSTPGYDVTQYQGQTITFDALSRAIELTTRAMVQRGDSVLVKSDTIKSSGNGNSITVGSDPTKRGNILVTPGQAPVISKGPGVYDIATRRASVKGLQTAIPQSGETLFITGDQVTVVASKDSVRTANDATYFLKDGTVTACDDSIPDYYFRANEIKRTGSFVVARPAILYIGDIPVMWLPFLFQDIRTGRHSGLIAPNVGVSDIVRNSPSYRRSVEGLGYYFALSDYFDASASLDWRSSAGESVNGDAGFVRYNGDFRYRWLERYVTGSLALSQLQQSNSSVTSISWGHQQNFTRNAQVTSNFQYTSNATLLRNTAINPYSVLSTIASQANYQQKVGPAQFSLGGSQKQYPGRTQLDRAFPSFSLTTTPLNLGSFLSWTPSMSYAATQSLDIDQPSPLGLLLRTGKTANGKDTVFADTLKRSAYTSSASFDSPLTLFGYNVGQRVSITSARNDFPEREIVTDVITGVETERIYAQTFRTEVNWTPSFTLPPIGRNNFNLSPSLTVAPVEGGAFAIRNERTSGRWVYQSFRPMFGISAAPTLFGLFNGFGPFSRIRHAISPTVSYSYAPFAKVNDDYLAALGRTTFSKTPGVPGYLGNLAQSSLSLGLSTNVEAKVRSRNDSNPEAGEKIKLLSVNFTSLSYDFERARATNSAIRGLTTPNFGYTLRSDLLPGIDIGVDYSLFEGSNVSDTARFSPFRERITAAVQFSNTANPFVVFQRIFGGAVDQPTPDVERIQPPPDDRSVRQIASQPVAGRGSRNPTYLPTVTKGWQASFNFTSSRQRPPTGNALNVVAFDPAAQCTQFNTPALKLAFDQCVALARTNSAPQTPITSGLSGSPFFITPPTTSLASNLNLNLTEHWAASWQTNYDFESRNFASQIVSLQRDLHDWRAIFAFTQSPNGSFAFNFMVSLKAEPDLKFDYHKATYRNEGFIQ